MDSSRLTRKVLFLMLLLLVSSSSPGAPSSGSRSPASYDQIVTWSDMADLDLRQAMRSLYSSKGSLLEANITESSYQLVLNDADNHIQPEFKIPAELKPAVAFWLRIYAEYTT